MLQKKTISSISLEDFNLFFLDFSWEKMKLNLNEIKSIHLKTHKINKRYYFFNFSILAMLLLLCQILNLSLVFVLVAIVLSFFWTYLMNRYRVCAVILLLNNGVSHKFYFDKIKKYYFLEKVKMIRGKLLAAKLKVS